MYKLTLAFFILCSYTAYGQITCNPPLYGGCSTSLATIPVSSTPSVGTLTGAGNIVTDPDFNSTRIMRATDANTEALKLNANFMVAPSGSGDELHFNCNDDRLIWGDDGGRSFLGQFTFGSPLVPMYIGATFPRGLFTIGAMFPGHNCPTNAYKAYTWVDSTATLGYYDVTNPAVVPSLTSIATLKTANCLGTGFNVTWTTNGEQDQSDTDFALGVSNNGGQGGVGALYVAVYRIGSGCRMLNISTSTVVGDWGPVGGTSGSVCTGSKIHNVKIYKSGGSTGAVIIIISGGTGCSTGGYVWYYNGLNISPECTEQCSGHFTEGLTTYINNAGGNPPIGAYWARRLNTSTNSWTGIVPALPTGGYPTNTDSHPGWNFLNDSYPYVFTTYRVSGAPIVNGWQNEIIAIDPSGTRNPIRLAHTHNSGKDVTFGGQIAVGSISQSGKYYAFTSDWQGTLGSTAGASTCTLGTNCRNDVFVAELYNNIAPAVTPVSVPNGGIFSSPTTAVISTTSTPTFICYNFTGAPATNGFNKCTNGTMYTGPIPISATTTVYAVAGGVGFQDSPIAAPSFVIVPPGGFKFAVSGVGTITGTGTFN